ncbi:MAG: ATP-binding protein, partial [Candidatus Methanomethylicota archaeon]
MKAEDFGPEIGVVASGATAVSAPVVLNQRVENCVEDEHLAVINDPAFPNRLFFSVVRRLTRYEPFLRERVRSVYVDYPDVIDKSLVMPFSNAQLNIYGALDLNEKRFRENTVAPHPGSKVYLVEKGFLLSQFFSKGSEMMSIGVHKYSGWPIPLDHTRLNCHIGVFGATGTGKSRLVRALVDEVVSKTSSSLIVFDHTGVDYAPFYSEKTIPSSSLTISPAIIASVLCDLARLSWQTFGEYLEIACVKYCDEAKDGKWVRENFVRQLEQTMKSLGARPQTIEKAKIFIEKFVSSTFFDELGMRKITPRKLIEKTLREKLVVVDLSADRELVIKQAVIRDVLDEGWKLIKEKQAPIDLGVVVDEAQNYVPEGWTLCGEAIETVAREGRKWKFFIILASQRVARD